MWTAFYYTPCLIPSCPACEPNSGSVFPSLSTKVHSSRGGPTLLCNHLNPHARANTSNRVGASGPRIFALLGVGVCPEEMQRDVRLFANDPTVMRNWRDVEQMSRSHLDFSSIFKRSHRPTRNDHPNMFNNASRRARDGSYML